MIKLLKRAGDPLDHAFRRSIVVWVWLGCVGFALPCNANAANDQISQLRLLRDADLRLATIAYRLQTANAALCETIEGQTGLVVHDLAQYAPAFREAARQAFALDKRETISVVVPGGPATDAGLQPGDRIEAINEVAVDPGPMLATAKSATNVDRLEARLAAAADAGPVILRIDREGDVRDFMIRAVPGCRARIRLVPGSQVDAVAGDYSINIATALVSFASSDDDLALAVAHELAHVVLHHRDRLAAAHVNEGIARVLPRNAAWLRETENEADRLGLYLMARAGYDIRGAPDFWRRFGEMHGPGLFGDGSHPSPAARARALALEINEIEVKRAAGQPLSPFDAAGFPNRSAMRDTSRRSEAPLR